jgi:hypothetical protein
VSGLTRVQEPYPPDPSIRVVGEIWAELSRDGKVVESRYARNKIGSMGRDIFTRRVASVNAVTAVGSPVRFLAVGSVGTPNSSGNTRLGSEWRRAGASAGDQRLVGSYAHPTGSFYFTLIRTFQAGTVTGGIREAGAFTRGSFKAGSMMNRGTFAVITKGASDTLKLTVKVTYT